MQMLPTFKKKIKPIYHGLSYAKRMIGEFFCHFGLTIILSAYCVGGAFLFQYFELPLERAAKLEAVSASKEMEIRHDNIRKLLLFASYTCNGKGEELKLLNETTDNFTQEFQDDTDMLVNAFDEFYQAYADAVANYGYDGTTLDENGLEYDWNFISTLLFTVTVVTSIGYGHISPDTDAGQLITIVYSLIGVPLMLMFLANVGDAMAIAFRVGYAKICCYVCFKKRRKQYLKAAQDAAKYLDEDPNAWMHDEVECDADGTEDDLGTSRPRTVRINDPRKISEDSFNEFESSVGSSGYDEDEIQPTEGTLTRPTTRPATRPNTQRREKSLPTYNDLMEPSTAAFGAVSRAGELATHWMEVEAQEDDVDPDEVNVPISLSIVVIVILNIIGGLLFSAWNGWSFIASVYFCFVTLSTIGFGDLVPGLSEAGTTSGNIKLFVSIVYIVFGLAVLSMCFNLMVEEMVAKVRWAAKKIGLMKNNENKNQVELAESDLASTLPEKY